MRIRWKLLLLLLIVSLGPLGYVFWYGHQASSKLGDELAAGTRQRLTSDAQRYLLQTVRDHGKLLRRASNTLQYNLSIQALAVERCLAGAAPTNPQLYFSTDFEVGGTVPDLVISDNHHRTAPGEAPHPMPVSFKHQSFLLSDGVELDVVSGDMSRLSQMLPTYQLLFESQSEFVQWHYTALENGLHCAYPGHGYYPENFDPRRRLWYLNARASGEMSWNPPIVDASTRQVILTRSMPIYRPDGTFAGVTAIDIRMTDLVKEVKLPDDWSRVAKNMLVAPFELDSESRRQLYIIAQHDFESDNRWDVPITPPVLTSDDTDQLASLTTDLTDERAAVRKMPYKGRDSLWAYSPLTGTGASLVAIVPYVHVINPALDAEQQVRTRIRDYRTAGLIMLGFVLLIVVIASMCGSRHITRPIRELVAAAHRIADGDLDTPTRVTTRDEIGELGKTVNEMLPQLRDRIKLKQSLALAMEVQQHLLPDEPPLSDRLDIAGKSIYCDETGGDYYDFVDLSQIKSHTLGVAVGDVTGHGIAAALLMATARSLLRGRADQPGDLGAVLNHMNRHLVDDVPVGKFMTLAIMLFDTAQNHLRWSSAGHDPILVYETAADTFSELRGGGIPLGIDSTWNFDEFGPQPLVSGQIFVIGTDGIWEARNVNREMFGKQRLRETIRTSAALPAREISEAITAAVANFQGTHIQDDDITLVVIKVR